MKKLIKALNKQEKISLISGLLAFIIPLIIYLFTAPRTIISYGDSAEIAAAVTNFSAAHPPGYPLFILLGKPFTFLPFETLVYKISIFTSLLGSFTVYFIYKIFRRFDFSPTSAMLSALCIGFSYSFWLYSIVSEVFILNNLISVIIIYLTLIWGKENLHNPKPKLKKLYLIFFLFGLGLSNHQLISLLIPGTLLLIFVINWISVLKKLHLLLFFFLLGFVPYLQTYLAAYLPHYPLFGNIPSPDRFLAYITRADYGGIFSATTGSGTSDPGLIYSYFILSLNQIIFLGPFLALFYVIRSIIKLEIVAIYFSIALILSAVLFPIYTFYGYDAKDLHNQGVLERLTLMGMMLTGITALLFLHRIINPHIKPNKSRIFQIFIFIIVITLIIINFKSVYKKDYSLSHNFAVNILKQVEPDSIIMTTNDLVFFALYYQITAEKYKPNVILINYDYLAVPAYQKELTDKWPDLYDTRSIYKYDLARNIIEKNKDVRPVYFVMLDDPYLIGFDANPNYLVPMGLLLKADLTADKATLLQNSYVNYWNKYDLSGLNKEYKDPFAKLNVYLVQFRFQINAKVYQKALCLDCAKKELSYGLKIFNNDKELKTALKNVNYPLDKQKITASEYIESAKKNIIASQNNFGENTLPRAIFDLNMANQIDPNNEQSHYLLAMQYEQIRLYEEAVDEYEKAAKINPKSKWKLRANELRKKYL